MTEEGSEISHEHNSSNTPYPSGTSSFACRLLAAAGSKTPQQLLQHQHFPAAHHHILSSSQVQNWDWVSEHSSDLSFELQFLKAWVVPAYTHCAAVGTVVAEGHAPSA